MVNYNLLNEWMNEWLCNNHNNFFNKNIAESNWIYIIQNKREWIVNT